jgi:hypothetical protein
MNFFPVQELPLRLHCHKVRSDSCSAGLHSGASNPRPPDRVHLQAGLPLEAAGHGGEGGNGAFTGQIFTICTGEFLYAHYSFLLISNKFWMGGSVGGRSTVILLNRTSGVMLLNRTGGVVWVLKPPAGSCT